MRKQFLDKMCKIERFKQKAVKKIISSSMYQQTSLTTDMTSKLHWHEPQKHSSFYTFWNKETKC